MDVKQISTITFARLSNAYHTSFMSSVKATVEMFEAEITKIDESLITNFNLRLLDETNHLKRTRVSEYTRQLDELDKERDSYFRRIWYKIKALENDCQNPAVSPELLHSIDVHIFRQYSLSICSDGNLKETAMLRSFANTVKNRLFNQLESLGLNEDLERLKTANDSYEELYIHRMSDKQRAKTTAELRDATDSAYIQLAYTIAANANNVKSGSEADIQRAACGQLIDIINSLIHDIKVRAYKDVTPDIEAPEPDDELEPAAEPAAALSPGDGGQTDFE